MDVQLPESELDLSDVAPIGLEFAFRIRILFKERVIFSPTTPNGGRVYVPPAGGDVFGPRLTGRVVPNSGADWGRFHSDGAAELNAHYMLEADDGTPIYINNRGFLYGRGPDGLPQPRSAPVETQRDADASGRTTWLPADNTYFVCLPVFDCPVGPHDWLTRTAFVGRGKRVASPDHTVFDYFAVL